MIQPLRAVQRRAVLKTTTLSLSTAIKDVLEQGLAFLDRVHDEVYAKPLEGVFSASLGAHYRHVLDHFLCLAEAMHTGDVNYDRRERGAVACVCGPATSSERFARVSGGAAGRSPFTSST